MSKKIKLRWPKAEEKIVGLTFEEFERTRCSHCGGAHLRACPRIKRMSFHSSGQLNEIEFWPNGQWDTSNVLWPESVVDSGDTNE